MRVDISFKNMSNSAYLDNAIAKDVEKIKKRVKLLKSDEPVHLSLHVEKNPHKEQYFAWANLYLPRKVLKSHMSSDTATLAINKTFSGLLKQIDKYKIKLIKHLQKITKS